MWRTNKIRLQNALYKYLKLLAKEKRNAKSHKDPCKGEWAQGLDARGEVP